MFNQSQLPVHPLTGLTALWVRPDGRAMWPIAGGAGTEPGNPVLRRLLDQRREQEAFIDQLLARVEEDGRDLVDAERSNLDAARERISQLDQQIAPLEEWETARAAHRAETPAPPAPGQRQQQPSGGTSLAVQPRGHEYRTRGEVIVDILLASPSSSGAKSPGGVVNIGEHRQRAVIERLQGAGVLYPGAPETYSRAIQNETTTEIPGLLPKPIVGAVENELDGSRPFVSSIGAKDLSNIPGKVFTRPTITQHTTSGPQPAEKTELPSRKLIVGGVDFTKETHGGALDVSRQTIDWSSPSAWDALLTDLQAVYGIDTEHAATAAFALAVTQATPAVATADLAGWATALYAAAATAYAGSYTLPNHIWVSLDMWATMGSIVDAARLSMRRDPGNSSMGSSGIGNFSGDVFDLPRTVVPSLPSGTVIVGVTSKTEFYEQRIGLLSAVEPRLLGVEIAYGGYVSFGTLNPAAFCKVTPPAGFIPIPPVNPLMVDDDSGSEAAAGKKTGRSAS